MHDANALTSSPAWPLPSSAAHLKAVASTPAQDRHGESEHLSLADTDDRARIFAERLGARLREARRRQRLSLIAVEKLSNQEFRASVLGAYERGERTISVPRLQRLARFYNIPVGRLLVSDPADEERKEQPATAAVARPPAKGRLTIDLAKLADADFAGKQLLASYVHSVRAQRNDLSSPIITLRDDDGRLLAKMLSVTESQLRQQLEERGIIPQPSAV